MKYDFDKIIDRRHTSSLKYDFAKEYGRSEDALPMWIADMDFAAPEFLKDALRARVEHGVFGYTQPGEDYFECVAAWMRRRHDWDPDSTRFRIANGVVFATCALVRAMTEPGDAVIVCQPVYYPFMSSIENNGRRLVVSELVYENGTYAVDYADFERKIVENDVKMFILCSPHNPVGRVWTEDELRKMGDICLRHGVFVVADEIHADFVYPGRKHKVFCSVRPEYADNCAVCTAPTKTFNIAGLQVSNIYLPGKTAYEKFSAELDRVGYCEPNVLGLTAARAVLTQGDEWLDELLVYLKGNLDYAVSYIRDNIPGVKAVEPEGTYLLWLDCSGLGLSESELIAFFAAAGLWLDDGGIFGRSGAMFERLNLAYPRSVIAEALGRLARAVRKKGK